MSRLDAVVARVAPDQHGLITRAQLIEGGIAPRAVDRCLAAGRLERMHAAVYRTPGAPHSWLQRVLAATLNAGSDAAAYGRTAAALWHLLPRTDAPIEVVVPVSACPKGNGFVVHRTRRPFLTSTVDGIRTTGVLRTLEDLVGVLPERAMEELVDAALYRRLISLDDVRAGRSAVGRLGASRSGTPVESVLETRFLRILRDRGVPLPVPQFEIRRGPELVARVDFAYPAERIAIEIDGYKYHSSRLAFDKGHRRQKEIQSLGYLYLPFTATDLARPRQVASTVRRFLWERGHPEVVQL